jgi:hypothetical protein
VTHISRTSMSTHLYMCPVTSLRTTTCSTIHLGDGPELSCPILRVVRMPRFLCCNITPSWHHRTVFCCCITTLYKTSLTRNTNSRVPRGIGTCDVSPSVPDIVTHELAEVVAALAFLEGNITTRYGSSAKKHTGNCLHLQQSVADNTSKRKTATHQTENANFRC